MAAILEGGLLKVRLTKCEKKRKINYDLNTLDNVDHPDLVDTKTPHIHV